MNDHLSMDTNTHSIEDSLDCCAAGVAAEALCVHCFMCVCVRYINKNNAESYSAFRIFTTLN